MEYMLTDCPIHGSVSAPDRLTFESLLPVVWECIIGRESDDQTGTGEHADWHATEGHACFACCNLTIVDPYDHAPNYVHSL